MLNYTEFLQQENVPEVFKLQILYSLSNLISTLEVQNIISVLLAPGLPGTSKHCATNLTADGEGAIAAYCSNNFPT